MKKFTAFLFALCVAATSFAQLDVVKLTSDFLDGENYLLSYVPAYSQTVLGVSGIYLKTSTEVVAPGSTHSLVLDYTGSWDVNLLENMGWSTVDASSYSFIKLNVYSPTELTGESIPSLVMLSGSDLMWDGSAIHLANYISAIPAGQWTEITVPIADTGASQLAGNSGVNICCTGWKGTGENTGKLYIDKLQFTTSQGTGIDLLNGTASLPYYSNGNIVLNGYQGEIHIFDLTGKQVFTKETADTEIPLQVEQGIYLLKTTKGTTKIVVQ